MKNNNPLVQEWLDRANDDELNARSIFKHKDGTPNAVCFLCQQGAEKLLKSALVFLKKETPKIHDLITLKEILKTHGFDASSLNSDLASLSKYYIGTRYPGDYEEFSWTDAQKALESLEKIKSFLNASLRG